MTVLGVMHTVPGFAMPAQACDSHIHLFGPPSRFPLAEQRRYTPPLVGLDDLARMQDRLGLSRAVVIQASVQGTCNDYMLECLERWPDRLRGIAVVADDIPESRLRAMDAAGVRGLRINVAAEKGVTHEAIRQRLATVAGRIAPLGWHVQLYVGASQFQALAGDIARLPCPVVFDHFGHLPTHSLDDPLVRSLVTLLEAGNAYVKLSAPHRVSSREDYEDLAPLARLLAAANPDRAVWGSDWPHVLAYENRDPNGPDPTRPEDDGANLDRLARWVGNEEVLHKILVDNPARLYRF